MKYKVVWSNFAETQLDEIFEYYSKVASMTVASKIARNIILKSERLSENPYLGAIEELLSGKKSLTDLHFIQTTRLFIRLMKKTN